MTSFLANVTKLASGNIAAQIISFGAMPLITRLYTPGDFGTFSIYLSFALVIFPLVNLRFCSALMLPENDHEAASLAVAGFIATIALSIGVVPLLVYLVTVLDIYDARTSQLLWLLVPGVLVQSVTQCLQFWMLRQKSFGSLGKAAVAESVTDRGLVLGFSQLGLGAYSLIIGRILGPLAQFLFLLKSGGAKSLGSHLLMVKYSEVTSGISRYRKFPLYSTWSFLFGNGARELPTVLLAILFSPAVVGAYALGLRVMNWPMLLVGDAIAKAYFQRAIEHKQDKERLVSEAVLLIRYTTYLMLPPMIVLMIFGPALFYWVFGAEWEQAGAFVQILAFSYFLAFQFRVIGVMFDIYERQHWALKINIVLFICRGLGVLVGAHLNGPPGAIVGLLIGSLCAYVVGYTSIMLLLSLRPMQWLIALAQATAVLSPSVIILVYVSVIIEKNAPYALLLVVAGMLIQLGLIAFRERLLYEALIGFIRSSRFH